MIDKELLELEELAKHLAERCYKIRVSRGRVYAPTHFPRRSGLSPQSRAELVAKRNAHIQKQTK